MVDATDLKSVALSGVRVRVPLWAPRIETNKRYAEFRIPFIRFTQSSLGNDQNILSCHFIRL